MPQNLIWLVKWSDRYWEPCSIRKASPRAAPAAVEPYSPASPMEIGCRAAKRSPRLQTCPPTHSAFQCSTAVKIQPQPSSTVNTRTPSVPHMRFGA